MNNTTWQTKYNESGYCVKTLSEMSGIDEGSFRKYLNGLRTPREKNLKKMESIMEQAQKEPRIKFSSCLWICDRTADRTTQRNRTWPSARRSLEKD